VKPLAKTNRQVAPTMREAIPKCWMEPLESTARMRIWALRKMSELGYKLCASLFRCRRWVRPCMRRTHVRIALRGAAPLSTWVVSERFAPVLGDLAIASRSNP
jgi:hypothetical protein